MCPGYWCISLIGPWKTSNIFNICVLCFFDSDACRDFLVGGADSVDIFARSWIDQRNCRLVQVGKRHFLMQKTTRGGLSPRRNLHRYGRYRWFFDRLPKVCRKTGTKIPKFCEPSRLGALTPGRHRCHRNLSQFSALGRSFRRCVFRYENPTALLRKSLQSTDHQNHKQIHPMIKPIMILKTNCWF